MSESDFVLPFLLHGGAVRGRLVRLSATTSEILTRHAYPVAVSRLLAETAALAAALADSLKYEGIFTLQASSNGPVRQLVADVTSAGEVRAYAGFDDNAIAALPPFDDKTETEGEANVGQLLGSGHLAFTVDQGANSERYQGIVALEGATLSECIEAYFRQSEQLQTAIKVVSRPPRTDSADPWQAAALMVQRMPGHGGTAPSSSMTSGDEDDLFQTAAILMRSVTAEELLSPTLSGERVLHRLFHAEALAATAHKPMRFACRCSRDKVLGVLKTFSPEDLAEMRRDDGSIAAQCQFCSTEYVLAPEDVTPE